MFPQPVRLALQSVSRVISRRVTTESLSGSRSVNGKKLDDVFQRLDREAKRTGRIATRDVINVHSLLQSTPSSNPTHALMLLRCCGSLLTDEPAAERNELVDKVWGTLKDKKGLDISHYNALLQVYIENNRSFNPLDFLRELDSVGLEPNRVTYQKLIHVYCIRGDIDGATKILEFMKQKDIPINESVFNSLILGYATIGDYKSANGTLEIMLKSDVEPTPTTYTTLLKALAKGGKETAADFTSVLDKAEKEDVFFMDRQKLDIIKELQLHDADEELVDRLLDTMQKKVGYIMDVYNVTGELLNAGKVDAAFKLFRTMPISSTAQRTRSHGMLFISQLVKSGQVPPERVFALCHELKAAGTNDYGIYRATEVVLEQGDRAKMKIFLNKFLELVEDPLIRPHYFWPVLARCKNEQEIMSVLCDDMDRVAYTSQATQLIDTLEHFVWPKVLDYNLAMERLKERGWSYVVLLTALTRHYLTTDRISAAITLMRDPKYAGVGVLAHQLDHETGAYLARTGTPGEAVALLKEILRSAPYHTDSDYVGIFLDGFMSNGGLIRKFKETDMTEHLLRIMKQERIRISPEYLQRLVQRFPLSEKVKRLLSDITLGTNEIFTGEGMEMDRALSHSLDDLENDLIELKSKGMNIRGTLRSLILQYCRTFREALYPDDGDSEEPVQLNEGQQMAANRVHELIREVEAINMQMTDSMKAVISEFYFVNGEFEKGYALKDSISPEFVIDDFKIFGMAQALIRANKFDDAVRLLEQEKNNRHRIERNQAIRERSDRTSDDIRSNESSIYRLANTTAVVTKDPKAVDQILDLVSEFRDGALSNVMLGPKIKVHILKGDVDGALEAFTTCVSRYKQTPWLGELMRQLIEKQDTANLQLITDLAISCHGESNTLYDLALAFVKSKKVNQARKVLSSASIRPNRFKNEAYCNRFIRDNDIEGLKQWVDVAQDIRDADRDELYFHLIRGYKSVNDPKSALGVWTEMQEAGVIPSQRTLSFLGKYLQSSGITPPFACPEIAADEEEDSAASGRQANRRDDRIQSSPDTEFVKAIRAGDVTRALEIRKERLNSGRLPTISQENMMIEKLVDADRLNEACEIVHQLAKETKFPHPRVLRNLTYALGKKGQVAVIEQLKPILPPEFTNQTFFSNCVADAYIESGQIDDLLQKLHTIAPFPLASMVALLSSKPEYEQKLSEIAKRLAESSQYYLPQNMMWLHKMKRHQFEEADSILQSTPSLKNTLLFSSIMKAIREHNDVQLADKLVEVVKNKTNLSPRTLGVAYSNKVDVLVDLNKPEEAEKVVLDSISGKEARIHSETGEPIPPVQITDYHRMCLVRLYNKLSEMTGREPSFTVPEPVSRRSENRNNGNNGHEPEKTDDSSHAIPPQAVGSTGAMGAATLA
jgi:leucine-rich PPR motif-containing protein